LLPLLNQFEHPGSFILSCHEIFCRKLRIIPQVGKMHVAGGLRWM
jgi:hypothetical protein